MKNLPSEDDTQNSKEDPSLKPSVPKSQKILQLKEFENALKAGFRDITTSSGKTCGQGQALTKAFSMGKAQPPFGEKFTLFYKVGHKGNWLQKAQAASLQAITQARGFGEVLYIQEKE